MLHLKKYFQDVNPGIVLDIGTRFGEFAFTLAEALPEGAHIIGIDCNADTIRQANEKNGGKGIEFRVGNAEHLDFANNSCELAAMSNTLHHIENYNAVLNEMLRVLRPGGTFLINEMYSDNQNEKQQIHFAQHSLEAKLDTISGNFHRVTWKRDEILSILSKFPLETVHIIDLLESPELDAKLAVKTSSLKSRVERLASGTAADGELMEQANQIEKRVSQIGIQRCTQLVYIGKKKV